MIFRILGFVLSSGARYFPSPEIVACDMIRPNKSRSLKRCVMLQNPSPIAIWFCFHYVRITCTIPGKKNGMEASFYPEFTRPPPTKLFTGPQLGSPLAPAPRCIKGLDLLRCCTNNLVSSPHRNQLHKNSSRHPQSLPRKLNYIHKTRS